MTPLGRAARLACWSGPVTPEPLGGGITNTNFTVVDRGRKFVVRVGDNIPEHHIDRRNELAAARAAHAAGLTPEIVHAEPGALVMPFIEGRTLTAADVCDPVTLARIVPVVRRCHREVGRHLAGPGIIFWVFHVVRDYARHLAAQRSRMVPELPRLLALADRLEAAVGPVDIVFGHNDLLPANLLDDGRQIWLLDWEYAGFNSPLFDLGGLASNAAMGLDGESLLLDAYFDGAVDAGLRRRYRAMKAASLLREAMWSMVSELHSRIDFDYVAYTGENMARLDLALADLDAA
ncbi:MAG: phosphotransferase [Geminicoccaceae bacterium]